MELAKRLTDRSNVDPATILQARDNREGAHRASMITEVLGGGDGGSPISPGSQIGIHDAFEEVPTLFTADEVGGDMLIRLEEGEEQDHRARRSRAEVKRHEPCYGAEVKRNGPTNQAAELDQPDCNADRGRREAEERTSANY
eukprot:g5033.t1